MGTTDGLDYDWEKEVEEFKKTKAGVKGLVDSGITKVPRFFIDSLENLPKQTDYNSGGLQDQIPVIDFQGINQSGGSRRMEIIEEIRKAFEIWGFFQMINHGVPQSVMDRILEGTRKFHQQPEEAKIELYSSDPRQAVRFYSTVNENFQESDVAGWKDAFTCIFPDDVLNPEALPSVCRDEIVEYMKYMMDLRRSLSELLSEALGLNRDFLEQMECMKSEYLACLYYPPCPEPDKTFGSRKHFDRTCLTILVQDNTGGLQIRQNGNWIDVPPVQGALIANMGNYLQLLTNDKFKSVEHRVLSRPKETRVSAACFFFPSTGKMVEPYGPIEELVSTGDNPPLYRNVSFLDFITEYRTQQTKTTGLSIFKL